MLDDHYDGSDELDSAQSMIEEQIAHLMRDAVSLEWVRPVDDVVDFIAEELGVADPEVFAGLGAMVENLADEGHGVCQLGDRVVEITRFAEAASFTHRLSAAEVEANMLELDVDLALLLELAEIDGGLHRPVDAAPLELSERVEFVAGWGTSPRLHHRLVGPDGWLSDHAAGDLVVVRAEAGYLFVDTPSEEPLPAATTADRLRDQIAAAIATETEGDGSPVGADELVLRGLVEGWWPTDEVLAPMREVVEAAGLEVEGNLVGPPGCWEQYALLKRVVGAFMRHSGHLDDAAQSAVHRIIKAFDDFCADPSKAPDPSLATALHRHHGQGAMCLHEELQRIDPSGEQVLAFAQAMPMPRGRAAAVKHTLESLGLEITGDPLGAEEAVGAAGRADPGWYPAVDARLGYLEARGDLRDVVNLMAVLREADDPELVTLRERLQMSAPDVGRNEPCPCGSGRKFKQCHLGRSELPLQHRVAWLLERAVNWVERYTEPDIDVARTAVDVVVRAGEAGGGDVLGSVLADVVQFELGGLKRFLDARRHLLPPDDAALVEGWLDGERTSLFRVDGIADDGTMTLVDVAAGADGETFLVARSEAFSSVSVHGLVWCRLLPVADGWVSSGVVMPVLLQHRASVLEALADRAALPGDGDIDGDIAARRTAVVAYLRKLYGVDRSRGLAAGDGMPWVHGVATWHVEGDRAAIGAVLDEAFGPASPDDDHDHRGSDRRAGRAEQWTRVDDDDTVLATIRVSGCLGPAVCSASPPLDAEALDGLDDGLDEDALDDDEFDAEAYSAYSARIDAGMYGYDVVVSANSIPRLEAGAAELHRIFPDAEQSRWIVIPGRRHHEFLRADEVMESLYSDGDVVGGDGDWDDYGFDPDLDEEFDELEVFDAFDGGEDRPGPSGGSSRLDEVMAQIPEDVRQQVLEEYSRAYEERWVDMEIPALGGRTPREAAADPELRADLLTLLAEFAPRDDRPGQMSPARIRTLLDLDPA